MCDVCIAKILNNGFTVQYVYMHDLEAGDRIDGVLRPEFNPIRWQASIFNKVKKAFEDIYKPKKKIYGPRVESTTTTAPLPGGPE